jgi:hypothetical protein
MPYRFDRAANRMKNITGQNIHVLHLHQVVLTSSDPPTASNDGGGELVAVHFSVPAR